MSAKPLPGIEHIIVLMYENRSFDNIVGRLYPKKSQSEYNGLTGDECNYLIPNDPRSKRYGVWNWKSGEVDYTIPYPDPGELFEDMNVQIFGTAKPSPQAPARMDGFVANYVVQEPGQPSGKKPVPGDIMHYFDPGDLPITSAVAWRYAVSDQWHASAPNQTFPNRAFAHVASPGKNDSGVPRVDNTDFGPLFVGSVTEPSIFDRLDEAYPGQNNWAVLYHDVPLSVLLPKVLIELFEYELKRGHKVANIDDTSYGFEALIENDALPKYLFLEPRYSSDFGNPPNSNHPGGSYVRLWEPNEQALAPPISVYHGEQLLGRIIRGLFSNPKVFDKTLLIVTYDEHGGCYDHAAPPGARSPFTGPVPGFDFTRYGVRVPALFVHPRINPGTIQRPGGATPYDHTSIIRTVREQFATIAGPLPALTPRDASAPVIENLLSLDEPTNLFDPSSVEMAAPPAPPRGGGSVEIKAFAELREALARRRSQRGI